MIARDLNLLIYNNWNVETSDIEGNLLTDLSCKRDHWLSSFYSGTFNIGADKYVLSNSSEGIRCLLNNNLIGKVTISTSYPFGRLAIIQLADHLFKIKRENLKEEFVITCIDGNVLLSISGKVYRDKQRNFFGIIYFDNKSYYNVSLLNYNGDEHTLLALVTVCGYCIRVFLEIDMGDYPGKII